jgi:hypothetical protein
VDDPVRLPKTSRYCNIARVSPKQTHRFTTKYQPVKKTFGKSWGSIEGSHQIPVAFATGPLSAVLIIPELPTMDYWHLSV